MSTSHSEAEAIPYAVIVKRRGDLFRLAISELDLVCDVEDLATGYRELEEMARGLLAASGGEISVDSPPAPRSRAMAFATTGTNAKFTKYLIIAGIVVLLAAVPGVLSISFILRDISHVVGDFRTVSDTVAGFNEPVKTARMFSDRARVAAKTLSFAAETLSEVTPQREEQVRRDLRLIVKVLKPFADEVRPLFTGEPPPSFPQPRPVDADTKPGPGAR